MDDAGKQQEPEQEPEPTHLQGKERRQVEERLRPSAAVIYETLRTEAAEELERTPSSLAWSALAAGLSMGFSLLTQGLLHAALPEADWRPLVVKLGYGVGFLIVIMGRQQLFTENTLSPILPLLKEPSGATFRHVMEQWSIILAANLIGTLAFAAFIGYADIFPPEVDRAFVEISRQALHGDFWSIFLRAVFAGWLIALMVWMLPNSQPERAWIILIITYLVALGHFSHIIVGSVEVLYLVLTQGVSVWTFFSQFFAPCLFGNIVGGVVLVALLNYAQSDLERKLEDNQKAEGKEE
jgi:formate/nitrite transporter FocA (FNT family)